ncbi:COP9 signalosome complex subunit 7a [Actinomortierella ambigua]|nr:COP9 signalosome complex subunit 7a [Actinomortierella ambigua]
MAATAVAIPSTAPAPELNLKSVPGQRLEPYLALSKSAKGAACVQLIRDVLAAPGVYVFGELLDMPNVAELKNNPDHASYHKLLEIFSYGTYQDYQQGKANLPELTDAQRIKLQQLSIVTLSEQTRAIPYKDLLTYLDISNVRQLEDLIMDAIYQDVLKASLDQKLKQVEVQSAMGRDLRPGQAQQMLATLAEWKQRSETLLRELDSKMNQVVEHKVQEKKDRHAFEELVEKARKEAQSSKGAGGGGPGGPGSGGGSHHGKHRKTGGGGGGGAGGAGGVPRDLMMEFEMSDDIRRGGGFGYNSPEFMSEFERMQSGGGGGSAFGGAGGSRRSAKRMFPRA